MNKQDVLAIGLKLFGVSTLFRFVEKVFQLLLLLSIPESKGITFFGISPYGVPLTGIQAFLYLFISYILFTRTEAIAKRIIPSGSLHEKIDRTSIFELVITYIGFIEIIAAIVYLVAMVVPVFWDGTKNIFSMQALISGLFLAIGILCLKFAAKISTFLVKKIPTSFWPK